MTSTTATQIDAPPTESGKMRLARPARLLLWFVTLVAVVVGLIKALVTEIIFADGAEYLTRVVAARGFYFHAHRVFAEWIMELPTVIAMRLFHVHSYHVLAILLGAGYYVFPAGFCALALYLARRSPLALCYAAVCTGLLFCLSGGDGEVGFGQALFILGSTILLLRHRLSFFEMSLVTMVSGFALNSYQGFALWSPALIVLLYLHERAPGCRSSRWFAPVNYVLLAASTGYSIWATYWTTSKTGADSLVAHAWNLHYYPTEVQHEIVWTFVLIALIVLLFLVGASKRMPLAGKWALVAVAAVVAASPFVWDNTVGPIYTYYFRGDIAALTIVIAIAAALFGQMRGIASPRPVTSWVLGLAAALMLFSVANTTVVATQWNSYQQQFANAENSLNGSIPVTNLGIQPDLLARFTWEWSNSLLGIILATHEGHVGVTNVGLQISQPGLVNEADQYAANPSLQTFPPSLAGYRW